MSSQEGKKDTDQFISTEVVIVENEETPDYYAGFPSFDDFGGLDNEINRLKESFVLAQHPELCQEWDVDPVKGIMLCGPGGVGKTDIVKALARETQFVLQEVQPSSILSMWVGEPVKKLREVFDRAEDSEYPTIIFFDEFDGIFSQNASGNRGVNTSIISEMKTLMNSVPNHVVVIAATNSIGNFDPALLRAGRFNTIIQINLPNNEARRSIFIKSMYKTSDLYDMEAMLESFDSFIENTEGMSGADIKDILKSARTKRVASHLLHNAELGQISPMDVMSAINQHRTSRPSL